MKQATNMLIKLLQEPRKPAAPLPTAQGSGPHSKFETYIAKAVHDKEMLLQLIKGGGVP